MAQFERQTNQGHKVLEIWQDVETKDLFVIVKRHDDFAWGSYYNMDKGYWGHGHYNYKSIVSARFDMLSMYGHILDLIRKFDM